MSLFCSVLKEMLFHNQQQVTLAHRYYVHIQPLLVALMTLVIVMVVVLCPSSTSFCLSLSNHWVSFSNVGSFLVPQPRVEHTHAFGRCTRQTRKLRHMHCVIQ